MRPDLFGALATFRTIAAERSFTRAAVRLGVTQSALSQTMKRLEAELGLKLLARTTRSVAPTHAGERLLATLAPALADITAEVAALADLRERPAGIIRVTAGKHAADTVLWPALARLVHAYPDIEVEVRVESAYRDDVDLVAERFDAGIRLAEQLEQDMIAVPVGPPLRTAVVGSPAYLARHGTPRVPGDLADHRCVTYRTAGGGLYAWEFERAGHPVTVKVGRGPVLNDGALMVAAAVEGFGLAHVMEDMVAAPVASGALVRVLEDWCDPFPGYSLYYPSRRQPTQAFTLFLDAMRHGRADGRGQRAHARQRAR